MPAGVGREQDSAGQPSSVKSIGYKAFSGCTNLTSVTIPTSVTRIDTYAFFCMGGDSALSDVYYGGSEDGWNNISFGAEVFNNPGNVTIHFTEHVHNWDSGVVTTVPTCTEAGVMTYTCTLDSSHTKTESIPATGHIVVTDAAVPATAASTGLTEGSHCSVCGIVLVAQQVVPKTDDQLADTPSATDTQTTPEDALTPSF